MRRRQIWKDALEWQKMDEIANAMYGRKSSEMSEAFVM